MIGRDEMGSQRESARERISPAWMLAGNNSVPQAWWEGHARTWGGEHQQIDGVPLHCWRVVKSSQRVERWEKTGGMP